MSFGRMSPEENEKCISESAQTAAHIGAAIRAQVPRRLPPCRSAAREGCMLLCACEECAPPHECMALASPCTARTLPYELCAVPRVYKLLSSTSCAVPSLGTARNPALPQRSISFLPSAVCTGVTARGDMTALRRLSSRISRYMMFLPRSALLGPASSVPPKRIFEWCAALYFSMFLSFIMLPPPRFFEYTAAPRRIGIIYGGTVYIITKSDTFMRCRAVIKIRPLSYYYYK